MLSALLLGILEGLTEFLPVSSTGHLIVADALLHFDDKGKVFEIVIQMGAILAVVWLYRARFWHVVQHLLHDRTEQHFVRNIFLAFLPALVLGALLHDFIKDQLFNTTVVAAALIVGGIAILLIERFKPQPVVDSTEAMTWRTALAIGFFQCVSMIPGFSRSGATIMGALLCRVTRPAAAEFSFSSPCRRWSPPRSTTSTRTATTLSGGSMELIAIGFVAAFIVALVVVRWLIRFVQTHGFEPFAYYRILLGIVILYFVR
ncbi:MAG: undecaprenyl-diphosphate phosphatase [Alphaproteobacteria bacterium]